MQFCSLASRGAVWMTEKSTNSTKGELHPCETAPLPLSRLVAILSRGGRTRSVLKANPAPKPLLSYFGSLLVRGVEQAGVSNLLSPEQLLPVIRRQRRVWSQRQVTRYRSDHERRTVTLSYRSRGQHPSAGEQGKAPTRSSLPTRRQIRSIAHVLDALIPGLLAITAPAILMTPQISLAVCPNKYSSRERGRMEYLLRHFPGVLEMPISEAALNCATDNRELWGQ